MNHIVETEGSMTEGETAAALYLARISLWHEAPEEPSIGGPGPRSKAITTSMVFHLYLAGRLTPRRKGVLRRIRHWFRLLANRWATLCAEEPDFQRHYRPNLFSQFDPSK